MSLPPRGVTAAHARTCARTQEEDRGTAGPLGVAMDAVDALLRVVSHARHDVESVLAALVCARACRADRVRAPHRAFHFSHSTPAAPTQAGTANERVASVARTMAVATEELEKMLSVSAQKLEAVLDEESRGAEAAAAAAEKRLAGAAAAAAAAVAAAEERRAVAAAAAHEAAAADVAAAKAAEEASAREVAATAAAAVRAACARARVVALIYLFID